MSIDILKLFGIYKEFIHLKKFKCIYKMRKRTFSSLQTFYNKLEQTTHGALTRSRRLNSGIQNQLNSAENSEEQITPVYNWNEWISATKTKNYLMNDPLLDYLDNYPIRPTIEYENRPLVLPQKIIIEKGNQFENEVMKQLHHRFPNQIREISDPTYARDYQKYQETINAMREGVPIIYQGVLHNFSNQTYGAPDLLIRSDFINQITTTNSLLPDEIIQSSPGLINDQGEIPNWYYIVVDIKWCSLNLKSDGIHLLNEEYSRAYKGQLLIYTQALSHILGCSINLAFILGRKWKYTSKRQTYSGRGWFDRLGRIDYLTCDHEYIEKTQKAIEWIRRVRTEGGEWTLSPPSIPELYPNMCNKYDGKWHTIKKDLAQRNGEITMVWGCGVNNRNTALTHDVNSWKDLECNSDVLGIKPGFKSNIIDKMLQVNRSQVLNMLPTRIQTNKYNWKTKDDIEFYFDFETVNDLILNFSNDGTSPMLDMIFMIGVGWYNPANKTWKYRKFVARDLDLNSERQMLTQFLQFIEPHSSRKFYHWGSAEKIMMKKCWNRHSTHIQTRLTYEILTQKWVDMLDIFKSEPIVIKGCFDFGLKNISKAMVNHGMIQCTWGIDKFGCSDGLKAMFLAGQVYQESRDKNVNVVELPKMKSIIEYNEIDCKVVSEIVNYLRNL